MDAQGITHPDVEVAFHRDEANGRYLFGVVVDGEFIPLLSHKLGRIDKLIQRAADRKSETQAAQSTQGEQQQTQQ